jgi:hypothetical protein
MSIQNSKLVQAVAITVLIVVATGCVNQRATPGYGRAGDYISVGLAGLKFNTDQDKNIRPSDLTAVFHHLPTATDYPVRIVNTFRAFPDHTSRYAVLSMDRSGDFGDQNSDIEPYDGQWWVVVKLDDPLSSTPIASPLGYGFIRVSSADITDTYGEDGDLANGVLFELIPGTASDDPSVAAQFDSYRAMESMTVQPSAAYGVASVGGFQIKLDYNISDLNEVGSVKTPVIPRLVPISHDPNINIIQHTVDNGSGDRSLIAMVTNPNGFIATSAQAGGWLPGNSIFEDLNMAIVVDDADYLANWSTDYALDPLESYYIDINGTEMGGVEPTLGFSN